MVVVRAANEHLFPVPATPIDQFGICGRPLLERSPQDSWLKSEDRVQVALEAVFVLEFCDRAGLAQTGGGSRHAMVRRHWKNDSPLGFHLQAQRVNRSVSRRSKPMRLHRYPRRLALRYLLLQRFGYEQAAKICNSTSSRDHKSRNGQNSESQNAAPSEESKPGLSPERSALQGANRRSIGSILDLTCRDIQEEIWQKLRW
jgi:hypothetical protein